MKRCACITVLFSNVFWVFFVQNVFWVFFVQNAGSQLCSRGVCGVFCVFLLFFVFVFFNNLTDG